MKITESLNIVLCLLLLEYCESRLRDVGLPVGPRSGEKGIYVYKKNTISGVYNQHCRYCPDGAFDNTKENIRTQEYSCIEKYDDIKSEIKKFERENKKYPICKVGEIPRCGPPPEENKTEGFIWSCDPGISNVYYSVYFSCALIDKRSRAVAWSYYCSEDLQWELDSSIDQNGESLSPTSTSLDGGISGEDEDRDKEDGSLNTTLFVAGILGTAFGIGCLIGCFASWFYRRRNQHGHSVHTHSDVEAMAFIPSVGRPNAENGQSLSPKASASLDSGISAGDEDRDMGEMTPKERQPPYGEERPSSKESNIDVSEPSSNRLHSSLECQTSEAVTNSHLPSDRNSCPLNVPSNAHLDQVSSHTLQSNIQNQYTTNGGVRSEFQHSFETRARRCQCLIYQKASSNPCFKARSLSQTNLLNDPNVSNDINDRRDTPKEGPLEGSSLNERPNPPGNVSINIYAESGYFDDENNERHNTKRKVVVESGTDVESQQRISCAESGHISTSDKKEEELFSTEQYNSQCICRYARDATSEDINDLSDTQDEVDSEQLNDLDKADSESSEKESDHWQGNKE